MPTGYSIGTLRRKRADGTVYRSYVIHYDDTGGSHRVSLGTDDRPTAEALAREFWSKRQLANVDSVGEIMTAFLAATAGASQHKRQSEAWKAAAPFWQRVRPGLIDADMCRAYARQRARSDNTVRNELAAIRSGLKWAKVQHATLWMPSIPESSVEHLTKPQFRRFMAGCSAPHVKLFAALAVATGGRSAALRELTWAGVDLERRQIDLNPRGRIQVANKRRATVPINDQLLPLLIEAKAGATCAHVIEYQGAPIASIKTAFAAASKRSRVHCTPHMLRHSAAVWMAEARTPMEEIASYLGHKNVNITIAVYARFSPEYKQRAAKALTW